MISVGGPTALANLLASLIPACRDSAADLIVVRGGAPIRLAEVEAAGVRVIVGPPDCDPEELRSLGAAGLATDIKVITTDLEPLSQDWSLLLSRLSQTVRTEAEEVVPAAWGSLLVQLGAPDPAG